MKRLNKLFGLPIKAIIYFFLFLGFSASLALSIFSVDFFVEYSSFTIGLTKAFIGMFALVFVDEIIYYKIDSVKEIQNKNVSYGLVLLGNAIIIAACIGFA